MSKTQTTTILRYIYLSVAIILSSLSIVSLSIWYKLMDQNLYSDALTKSGIYEVTSQIIEDKTTLALLNLQNELLVRMGLFNENSENPILNSVLVWGVSTFLEDATSDLVTNVYKNVGLQNYLTDVGNNMINSTISWLKGDSPDPEFFSYIPEPEDIKILSEAKISDFIYAGAIQAIGINKLPLCTSDLDVNSNLQLLRQRNILKLTCTNDLISSAASGVVEEIIPKETLMTAEESVQGFLSEFGLDKLLDQMLEVVLFTSVLKQNAIDFRDFIQTVKDLSILAFLTAIPFLGLGLYVTKHGKRIRTLLQSCLLIGVIVAVFGLFHYYALARGLNENIDYRSVRFVEGFLDPVQQALVIHSMKQSGFLIIQGVVYFTIRIGFLISFISLIPLLIVKLNDIRKQNITRKKKTSLK